MEFNDIKINADQTLNIDVGSSEKSLLVNTLNISGGFINIIGEGTLTIYVTGEIILAGNTKLNENGYVNQLNIFWAGSGNSNPPKSLGFGGNQTINGSIHAEDANFSLSGSGNVKGNLFTGGSDLTITGGSSNHTQLFFAPNADITFSGSGTVRGRVIGKNVHFPGSDGKVIFDNYLDNYIKGPISIETLQEFNEGGSGGGIEQPPGQIQPGQAEMAPTSSLTEINE